jgi:hypothetical protein
VTDTRQDFVLVHRVRIAGEDDERDVGAQRRRIARGIIVHDVTVIAIELINLRIVGFRGVPGGGNQGR